MPGVQPKRSIAGWRMLPRRPAVSRKKIAINSHAARASGFAYEEMLACGGKELLAAEFEFVHLVFLRRDLGAAADDSDAQPTRLQSLRQFSVTLCDSGQASVKRAPPSGDSPALAAPWCCSKTSCTIASPRP